MRMAAGRTGEQAVRMVTGRTGEEIRGKVADNIGNTGRTGAGRHCRRTGERKSNSQKWRTDNRMEADGPGEHIVTKETGKRVNRLENSC